MNDVPIEQRNQLHVSAGFQPIFRELGIDAEAVFVHPQIKPWRTLDDRENCTLTATLMDGRAVRFHVKRYAPVRSLQARTPADAEVAGQRLLVERQIPTVDLVAWGNIADGRSFVIVNDLPGYEAADKLVERGVPFAIILEPTAQLAAKLHDAGLHHRDLYLCHFFANMTEPAMELKLIDTARVRELPRFFPRRWIIKDLAQFWYSTMSLPASDEQRDEWLKQYARYRSIDRQELRAAIERKVGSIARHDRRLRRHQPTRNISIPAEPA